MKKHSPKMLLAAALLSANGAHASEAGFLRSLEGVWRGGGTVVLRTGTPSVRVSCTFDSDASDTSLSLDGKCRGLIVASRNIAADLKTSGGSYSGTYVGSRSGTARLEGQRSGNAINLDIRWARNVNGDRTARLTVQKVGANGMKLTVVDFDPKTGRNVVTSDINLSRL